MITIGADPEFFLGDKGSFVPAYGLVPGTKWEPHPVTDGAVQVDGVAVEVNTLPTTDFHQFKSNISSIINTAMTFVPGLHILQDSTVTVDVSSCPPEALILGCSPDVDPYTEESNSCGIEGDPRRSAGGHIHIGGIFTDDMSSIDRWRVALRLSRLLDKYVGVYSLLWDKDNHRRSTYGRAGNCRVKDYGVEYRCLSNAWLFNDKVMEFVYNQVHKAVVALNDGEDVTEFYRDIINNSDATSDFFSYDVTAQQLRVELYGQAS